MTPRRDICRATARALQDRRAELASVAALVGFDGFIDEICAVVESRPGTGEDFAPVPTIHRLAEKIAAAAGQSGNLEVVVRQTKLGGNGPILANALAAGGMAVTYVGNVGYPEVHPAFAELARRAEIHSIAPPAHTDALEFADGKLMLGKLEPLRAVTWENLRRRLGAGTLEALVGRARIVCMVNWTMIPQMSRIWAKLISDVLPALPPLEGGARRTIFIDLADPEKRSRDDLRYALRLLTAMQAHAEVTLGLNLKEARQVCGVLDLPAPDNDASLAGLAETAAAIRGALEVECCVVHPRTGAAAATAGGQRAAFEGPFVRDPAISTGAGDHFNAGFLLGRALGLPLEECLCAGVGTSGAYVRTTRSPTAAELSEFIAEMPEAEPED